MNLEEKKNGKNRKKMKYENAVPNSKKRQTMIANN